MATGITKYNQTQYYPAPQKDLSFNSIDYPQAEIITGSGTTKKTIPESIDFRLYQDLTYSVDDGYYGLAKDASPLPNTSSAGVLAVSTWTTRTTNNYWWYSVCWSPQLAIFCSVGTNGLADRAMTSPDGMNWTTQTTPNSTNDWSSICWSPKLGLFCAVSYGGASQRIMTSPNGTAWTLRTSPVADVVYGDICWGEEIGLFVAVAYGGIDNNKAVMTSPDGINWTNQSTPTTTPASYIIWTGVCWSAELKLFVAVGNGGKCMTSPDGVSWTMRTLPNTNNYFGVCWSPQLGLFCAVASSGTSRVITSADGFNWNERTTNTNNWYKVCWSAELGLFCAVAQSGTDRIMTSPDGITWTTRTSTFVGYSICWSPELGLFCSSNASSGTNTQRILTSSFKGRPPSSYNMFNCSSNRVDENGLWSMTLNEVRSTLTAQSSVPSFKITPVSSNTTSVLYYLENASFQAYNKIVNAGDCVLIGGKSDGTGTFTIANWLDGYCGIVLAPAELKVQMGLNMYYTQSSTLHRFTTGASTYIQAGTGATAWTGSSDARLKKDITDIEPCLDKVCALRPVEYRFNDEDETKDKRAGLIAQEVLPIFPLVVSQMEDGYYGIKYTELIPYLIKSVQELKDRVDVLKNKISP